MKRAGVLVLEQVLLAGADLTPDRDMSNTTAGQCTGLTNRKTKQLCNIFAQQPPTLDVITCCLDALLFLQLWPKMCNIFKLLFFVIS